MLIYRTVIVVYRLTESLTMPGRFAYFGSAIAARWGKAVKLDFFLMRCVFVSCRLKGDITGWRSGRVGSEHTHRQAACHSDSGDVTHEQNLAQSRED